MNKIIIATLSSILLLTSACASDSMKHVMESNESQVQTRQIQSRVFDTSDSKKMMRSILSTLQDLRFVIDKVDANIGTISATKLDGYDLKITVSVREKGTDKLIVRANATYNVLPVKDKLPYQQFFSALEKSIFLTAHEVD
jgi:hypothetical protein